VGEAEPPSTAAGAAGPNLARSGVSRKLAGEFVAFSSSTLALQVSRLAVALVVARWVGPAEFGIWNAFNLLLLYGALITLGTPNGMSRDVPLLTGAGDQAAAQRTVDVTSSFVFASGLVAGVLISLAGASGLAPAAYRSALLAMGLLFFGQQIYTFLQMWLRCRIQFHLMSLQQVVYAATFPLVVLPLAKAWHVPGFIVGQALVALALGLFIVRTARFRATLTWRWPDLRSLIAVGFPIMIAGVLYGLLISVDRWVILTFLDVEALGHYSLAIICVGVLGLLPSVISQQMYPRMAYRYGATRDERSLWPLVLRQSAAGTAVTLPVLALVYLALPTLVTHFMPAYAPGLIPARILLIGLAFIPLAGGVGNFLNTVGRQVTYMIVQGCAVAINLCLDLLFVKLGWGLIGVATGASITYALYSLGMSLVGLIIIFRHREPAAPAGIGVR
jgi:O-antigen/teichoic acid export membrane protein